MPCGAGTLQSSKEKIIKILLLDCETAPMTIYAWGLYNQNHNIDNIIQSGYVICWAAKWLGEEEIMFDSMDRGHEKMIARMHKLLHQADAVVHYNGLKFDIPTLNKEFVKYGMPPPSPYKNIDLYQSVKRLFRFESNKLDYVSQALGLGEKVKHRGFELWIDCMKGDKEALSEMETYNRQDVVLLEKLYLHLLPWLTNHPNKATHNGQDCCPNCGSENYQRRGRAVTRAMSYKRYQCRDCGHWFKSTEHTKHNGSAFRQITG